MRRLINFCLILICFSFLIILSYQKLYGIIPVIRPDEVTSFLKDDSIKKNVEKSIHGLLDNKQPLQDTIEQRSIWVSYIELQGYQKSVKNNNETNFRLFYETLLNKCRDCHITNIIVQVRPFSDSLYPSQYFPWAECISGKQGKNPGYDPLKIMTELTHKENMTIEAWVNPYRICNQQNWKDLSARHPAKIWANDPENSRTVLFYDHNYYWNPSIPQVQKLIVDGITEIVQNYSVDGIHMDDYFYPSFTKENISKTFDYKEYKEQICHKKISKNTSIAKWRRDNITCMIKKVYQAIKTENKKITFGISPQGNLKNLRSDFTNYTDVDLWVSEKGYIDYIMPQIYWGYQRKDVNFEDSVKEWMALTDSSPVDLKIGLQLYQYGEIDQSKSDYQELQNAELIKKEISFLREKEISGYSFFSYQYIDCQDKNYHFNTTEFSASKKAILKDIVKYLEK